MEHEPVNKCYPWNYKAFVVFTLSFLLCSTDAQSAGDFVLGPGDIVRVTVFQHPDLGGVTRVSQGGNISFPLLGEVELGGMTPDQAEIKLASLLEEAGFVKSAHVSLIVEEYHSQKVSVLGQVRTPGKYPVVGATTIVDLLALAGGIKPEGADIIKLIRRDGENVTQTEIDLIRVLDIGDLTQDAEVSNGDIVYVPRMDMFYIYGQVQRPGAFRLERNMNVMQAIAVSGGLTQQGTEKGIRINRRDRDGRISPIDADVMEKLFPNDVIYVKQSLF